MSHEEIYDTIVNTGTILDPEIELLLCELNLKVRLNSKGYPKTKLGLLSRLLLNAPKGLEADHINGDPLDNRMCNLRLVTRLQNMWNTKKPKHNKSGVKGVSRDPDSLLWVAAIWVNKVRYRKRFKLFEDAVKYRKELEIKNYGRFNRGE